MCVVELVLAIVIQKKLQSDVHEVFVFGIAESTTNKHWGTVADVSADDLQRQFMAAEVAKHRIYGVAQVLSGMDLGSIQIKNQQPQFPNGNLAINLHCFPV